MNEVPKNFNRVRSIRSHGPADCFMSVLKTVLSHLRSDKRGSDYFSKLIFLQSPGRFAQPTDQRFSGKRFSKEVALGEVAVHLVKPV